MALDAESNMAVFYASYKLLNSTWFDQCLYFTDGTYEASCTSQLTYERESVAL